MGRNFWERKNVLQKRNDSFRRWFETDIMELIVWYNDDRKSIRGFQLCYGTDGENAFTWRKEGGFSHDSIDEGKARFSKTPILVANGALPSDWLIENFERRAVTLEEQIRNLVLDKLHFYAAQTQDTL